VILFDTESARVVSVEHLSDDAAGDAQEATGK
jgi:hypothetical protein